MFFLNPFSIATKFSAQDGKGVYVFPHSDSAPDGWGEPRRAEDGTAIVPGTQGGDHPNALIAKKDGEYKKSTTKYHQKAGNITWWGKFRDPQVEAKGRHVLSYLGPKLRYFLEIDFNYGSSETHSEIYYQGGYAAVAPGPVLGACVREAPYTDPVTGVNNPTETYIYVAVYKDQEDKFYRKRWAYRAIPPDSFSDAVRVGEMALRDDANPDGWELIGTFARPSTDHYRPETPWFFNESGTEAVALRRKKITFDNGSGANVTERTYDRLVVAVGDTSVSVTNLGNLPAMEYTETILKENLTYHQDADFHGYSHDWEEDHVSVVLELAGEQYVFGDYIGNTRYWGKIEYNLNRIQKTYFTKGTDPSPYNVDVPPGSGTQQDISNANNVDGPYWHDIYEYGFDDPNYAPSEGDHNWTNWVKFQDAIKLHYGPESDPEEVTIDLHVFNSGTSDQWAGHPRQDTNPFVFFYEFFTRNPRALFDIRDFALFTKVRHRYALVQSGGGNLTTNDRHIDKLYISEIFPEGEEYRAVNQTGSATLTFGWPREDMETWAVEIDEIISRTTYEGVFSEDNANAELFDPGSRTFYQGTYEEAKESPPTIPELLYGDVSSDVRGNGVRTERGEVGLAVEVPNVENPGQYVILSKHKPEGEIADIVGFGEKFYPVGAC